MAYHYKKDLEALLNELVHCDDRKRFIKLWTEFYEQPIPKNLSSKLLKLAIIYRIKEKLYGGLKPAIRKYLFQLAKANNKAVPLNLPVKAILKPGSHLIRKWHGETYQVKIYEKGYEYEGKIFKSLSEIARNITGIHLNGPKFFGLRKPLNSKELQLKPYRNGDLAA